MWTWLLSLFIRRYEVTVWFAGDTIVGPDGVLVSNRKSKTYYCKTIVKISHTHIQLIDIHNQKIEIKPVNQVGYDIHAKKIIQSS